MKIFDAKQTKAWDAATIKNEKIASIKLMERAAKACVAWIEEKLLQGKHFKKKTISIFCGPGNNGGDGLAIARLLLKKKKKVKVYVLKNNSPSNRDFEKNLEKLKAISSEIRFINKDVDIPKIEERSIIIDALFGTGLSRPLTNQFEKTIRLLNASSATIVSIDLPSGMYSDESSKGNPVIRASYTLSFQQYKLAFLMPENEGETGAVHIMKIGLDNNFESAEITPYELVDEKLARSVHLPRKLFSHKGNHGHALLIAGSYGKMGAAVLAAKGCLRSGVGLLTMQVPEQGYEITQTAVPEAMAITASGMSYNLYNAIGIGPGSGTNDSTVEVLSNLLHFTRDKTLSVQLVIDADGLNILATHKNLLSMLPAGTILTPHPKEFARLFGESKNDFDRLQLARQKAAELNCYIILKGHYTAICTPGKNVFFNNTGNPGLATGGSGDVLTGILTGLAAQGYPTKDCCLLGVYLHGMAGDIASKNYSIEAIIAGDIPEYLGEAYRSLLNK